jgi:serine/threonine-protein kinase
MEALRADLLSCAGATSPGRAEAPSRSILLSGRKKLVLLGGAGLIALTLIAAVLFTHVNPSSPRPKKIAVLPFENLGPAEDEYFADGLTDEIASRLSSIHGLGVISRTSSTQYKKTTKPLPVVGKELGVDYILEGAIRWEEIGGRERIRITPRLIQISGDVNLWADNFDRTLDDIFAIQTEIATMVVRSLDIVLGESENRAINAVPTKNLEAYQSYLRGLWFSARFERPNVEMAIDMLTRAVELDSTFARAYAELSIAHMYEYWYGFDRTNVRLARARGYLDRAFALQPDLPEANLALGYYHLYGSRDYTQALEAFAAAERSLPNSSRAIEADGYVWRRQGKFEAAAERLKQAFELDPQNGGLLMEIGNTFRMLGRYAEAQEYLDRSISLLPDQSIAYIWKARIDLTWHGDTSMSRTDLDRVPRAYTPVRDLVWLDLYERRYQSALDRLSRLPGPLLDDQIAFLPISMVRGLILEFMKDTARAEASFDTARVYLESQAEERPEDGRIHQSLGIVYAGLGRREAAIHEARLAVEELPLTRDAWWGVFPVITLAQVYTMTGRYDAAIDQLESLLSGVASREITPPILLLDPNYDPLRNNPRFQSLLTKYASP